MKEVAYGQRVISTAGRDARECFIVIAVELPYCYLSDGKTRRFEHPKKKKLKHLQVTDYVFEEIHNRLIAGDKISNADIRNSLKNYLNDCNLNNKPNKEE